MELHARVLQAREAEQQAAAALVRAQRETEAAAAELEAAELAQLAKLRLHDDAGDTEVMSVTASRAHEKNRGHSRAGRRTTGGSMRDDADLPVMKEVGAEAGTGAAQEPAAPPSPTAMPTAAPSTARGSPGRGRLRLAKDRAERVEAAAKAAETARRRGLRGRAQVPAPRCFIRGLPAGCSASEIRGCFSAFGEVVDAYMPPPKGAGGRSHYAFVTFRDWEAAGRAVGAGVVNMRGCEVSVAPESPDKPRQERDAVRRSPAPAARASGAGAENGRAVWEAGMRAVHAHTEWCSQSSSAPISAFAAPGMRLPPPPLATPAAPTRVHERGAGVAGASGSAGGRGGQSGCAGTVVAAAEPVHFGEERCRVFVGGLEESATLEKVLAHFARYGTVLGVQFPVARRKQKQKVASNGSGVANHHGFCFVTFEGAEAAGWAILDGQSGSGGGPGFLAYKDVAAAAPKPGDWRALQQWQQWQQAQAQARMYAQQQKWQQQQQQQQQQQAAAALLHQRVPMQDSADNAVLRSPILALEQQIATALLLPPAVPSMWAPTDTAVPRSSLVTERPRADDSWAHPQRTAAAAHQDVTSFAPMQQQQQQQQQQRGGMTTVADRSAFSAPNLFSEVLPPQSPPLSPMAHVSVHDT